MGSYDDLVFTIPQEFHHWYGFVAPRGFFRGTTMMKDAKVYMDWSAVDKSMIMEVPHTHHCADEYLVFTTADMKNFFDWDRRGPRKPRDVYAHGPDAHPRPAEILSLPRPFQKDKSR